MVIFPKPIKEIKKTVALIGRKEDPFYSLRLEIPDLWESNAALYVNASYCIWMKIEFKSLVSR